MLSKTDVGRPRATLAYSNPRFERGAALSYCNVGVVNGDGAREVKTKRPGDEVVPEQAAMGTINVQLHTREG
jgi:hypothetical protein